MWKIHVPTDDGPRGSRSGDTLPKYLSLNIGHHIVLRPGVHGDRCWLSAGRLGEKPLLADIMQILGLSSTFYEDVDGELNCQMPIMFVSWFLLLYYDPDTGLPGQPETVW